MATQFARRINRGPLPQAKESDLCDLMNHLAASGHEESLELYRRSAALRKAGVDYWGSTPAKISSHEFIMAWSRAAKFYYACMGWEFPSVHKKSG